MIILRLNPITRRYETFLPTGHGRDLFRAPATCHGRFMFGCLSAITKAFNNGTQAPKYALISWHYHACYFLSTSNAKGGLEELKDKTRELIRTINFNWLKLWMIQALCWAGAPYLQGELPPSKDLVDTDWTRLLQSKSRSISVILENVS